MTIYDLYNVNNDWDKDTVLTIRNRDNTIYERVTVKNMTLSDRELQVINFRGNDITVVRKPLS